MYVCVYMCVGVCVRVYVKEEVFVVPVLGNGHTKPSSNPGWGSLHYPSS